jgi:FkbM family methyltransferase
LLRRRIRQAGKAAVLLRHPVFRRGLRHGVGASIEHLRQMSGLSLATVVDIGANVGQFSLLIRGLYADARIFAFEPLARPAGIYRRLFSDDPLIRLYQKAIAPAAKTGEMHVARRDDSSSLLPISARQVEFAPGTDEVRREAVALVPLDEHVSARDIVAPALLKLDVQGFELEALKGCDGLLHRFDYVFAEVSFLPLYDAQALAGEVVEWLAARKFRLCGIGNPSAAKDGRIVQADFMFRKVGPRASEPPPAHSASDLTRADN